MGTEYGESPRRDMLKYLTNEPRFILDVGCGVGAFGAELLKYNQREVWGVELNENRALKAKEKLTRVFCGDINEVMNELPDRYFDCIIFNDILEHLVYPEAVLYKINNKLSENGIVVVSIPNLRHFKILFMILWEMEFKYVDKGIMDKTHLRFFTEKSAIRLFEETGYTICHSELIHKSGSIFAKVVIFFIKLISLNFIFQKFRDIEYFHIVIVAKKGIDSLTNSSLEERPLIEAQKL